MIVVAEIYLECDQSPPLVPQAAERWAIDEKRYQTDPKRLSRVRMCSSSVEVNMSNTSTLQEDELIVYV